MSDLIAGQTTERFENGTITTIHLTDKGRQGLTCDADSFRKACDESLRYYENRRIQRSWILFRIAMHVIVFILGLIYLIASNTLLEFFAWLIVVVGNVLFANNTIDELIDHDGIAQ